MNRRRIHLLALALGAASLLAARTPAQGPPPQSPPPPAQPPTAQRPPARIQIPDTFTNLQVLPKDITKPELVTIMKTFAITFEKRCSYCHVATDDLSEADFPSDEKATKKQARQLLRLIRDVQKKPATTPNP